MNELRPSEELRVSDELSQDEVTRIESENALRYLKEEGMVKLNDLKSTIALDEVEVQSLLDEYNLQIDDLIDETLIEVQARIISIEVGVETIMGLIDSIILDFLNQRVAQEFDLFYNGASVSHAEEFASLLMSYEAMGIDSNFVEGLLTRDLSVLDSDKFLILYQNLSDEFLVSFVNYMIDNVDNSSDKLKGILSKLSVLSSRYFSVIIDGISEPLKSEIFTETMNSLERIDGEFRLDILSRSRSGSFVLNCVLNKFKDKKIPFKQLRKKYYWFSSQPSYVKHFLHPNVGKVEFTTEFFRVENPSQKFANLNVFKNWVTAVQEKYQYDFTDGFNDEMFSVLRDSLIRHFNVVHELYADFPELSQDNQMITGIVSNFISLADYIKRHEGSANTLIRSFFASPNLPLNQQLFLDHENLNSLLNGRGDIDVTLNVRNANSYILAYGFRNNLLSRDFLMNFKYSSNSTFNQKMFNYFKRNFSNLDSFNKDCLKFLEVKGLGRIVWRLVKNHISNDELVLSFNNQEIKSSFMREIISRRESLSIKNLELLCNSNFPNVEGFAFRELLSRSDSHFSSMVGLRPDGSLPSRLDVAFNNDSSNQRVSGRKTMQDFLRSFLQRDQIQLSDIQRLARNSRYKFMARRCLEMYELRSLENPQMSPEEVLRSILSVELDKLYKFDKRRGQGAIMHNLLAFRRVADYVRVPQGATSYSVVYPGGAYHLSGLETVSSILSKNPNLESLNFTITEWKDYRIPIYRYLKVMQGRGLISDLSDNWTVNTGPEIDELVSSLSNLSFKINNKQVNFNFSFRSHASNSSVKRGIDYFGQDNGSSDLIFIHDLDTNEDDALGNVIHYLRENGGQRTLVFPYDRLGDEAYMDRKDVDDSNSILSLKEALDQVEDLSYEILYQNKYENYGCHCLGEHAHGGMVVVRIQKIEQ